MVERGGFEPPKAEPADLQSAPFDRSGTSPREGVSMEFPEKAQEGSWPQATPDSPALMEPAKGIEPPTH
jgi:hypothetical protein